MNIRYPIYEGVYRILTVELPGLETCQRDQPAKHRCGISVRGIAETGDSRHHHGATPRRTAFERARPYRRPPEATRTGTERRLLGFPVCRLVSRRTHRAERHDLHGAPARQSPHLLPVATVDGRGKPFLVRHRRLDDAVSDHPV